MICTGLSSQSMCTPNCTWKDHLEIDLYPWDAGTDSRVTYLGRKIPTQPPERIHRLTSHFPNDSDSPFHGIDIKPFARLTLIKNKEACTDDDGRSNSAESPSTDELVSMMKKKMMEKKMFDMEKCATSLWSEWTECSVPCGPGQRERRRMLKNPGITKDMCDVDLTESEACVGQCKEKRKKLHDSYVMRHDDERDPSDVCAVTGWSDWSPCSATCGLGMKERWRMFIHNTEKKVDCGIHLMEKDLCRGEIFDCQKAMMMKNFTAICQQDAEVGPCRGDFPRWFYNHTMEKCQIFSYGGCRGNENRFETEKECVDLCAEHMADVFRKEHMIIKQEMPSKQMEIEKHLMMEKERMMAKEEMLEKAKTMEEDMRRKEVLMQKQKMEESARIEQEKAKNEMIKQQMLANQEQEKKMQPSEDTSVEEKENLMINEKKMQRKREKLDKRLENKRRQKNKNQRGSESKTNLSDGPVVDCMVTPWSEWTPCSVTCGKGFITKTRMIKVQPQNGGRQCPKKLMKKKKCKERKCPVSCELSEWSEWSSCSKTCGESSIQVRQRRRLSHSWRGSQACPPKRERRYCNVPMCIDDDVQNPYDSMPLHCTQFGMPFSAHFVTLFYLPVQVTSGSLWAANLSLALRVPLQGLSLFIKSTRNIVHYEPFN
ncbi:hypothetical protein Btru_041267 [Bulinus truncatus]|nr:hypothetical protein Btru_041267 [Bulinus truncatus]